MALSLPKKHWTGSIRTITVGHTAAQGGTRAAAIEVGGASALPFHRFEGEIPNAPVIAFEVPDVMTRDWQGPIAEQYEGLFGAPVDWAKRVVEKHGAQMICLHLKGADPDHGDKSPDECAALVRDVLDAVKVPLIIKGPGPGDKQNAVLARCAEAATGEGCLIASAVDQQYKTLVAACIAYGHGLVAETPIDLNLAKQLNILLADMNFPREGIVIDPLTGGLGYGLEYTYSVMERIRIQALAGDAMMQMPFICFVGPEVWKTKEARLTDAECPSWGEQGPRGILWESSTALSLLLAGADILVMRHPAAIASTQAAIRDLMGENANKP